MKFSCIQSRFLFSWTLQWKGTLLLLTDLPARLSTSDLFLLKKLVTMRKCMHVHRLKADRQKMEALASTLCCMLIFVFLTSYSREYRHYHQQHHHHHRFHRFLLYRYVRTCKSYRHTAFAIEREKNSRNDDNT
jgi:hypothetical protein